MAERLTGVRVVDVVQGRERPRMPAIRTRRLQYVQEGDGKGRHGSIRWHRRRREREREERGGDAVWELRCE